MSKAWLWQPAQPAGPGCPHPLFMATRAYEQQWPRPEALHLHAGKGTVWLEATLTWASWKYDFFGLIGLRL